MGIKRHRLGCRAFCRLIPKGDFAILNGNDPAVWNCNPMDIACQVVEHFVGALNHRFAIDDPILMPQRCG